jgi:hypothetical protein
MGPPEQAGTGNIIPAIQKLMGGIMGRLQFKTVAYSDLTRGKVPIPHHVLVQWPSNALLMKM